MKKRNNYFKNLIFTVQFFLPFLVHAQGLNDAFKTDADKPLGRAAWEAGYNPVSSGNNIEAIIGMVIQTFLAIIGIIFLILMIYAGYSWMTAHGDEQKVTKAKETITASIIGLVIVIGAYAITYFVISKLTTTTLISR